MKAARLQIHRSVLIGVGDYLLYLCGVLLVIAVMVSGGG